MDKDLAIDSTIHLSCNQGQMYKNVSVDTQSLQPVQWVTFILTDDGIPLVASLKTLFSITDSFMENKL